MEYTKIIDALDSFSPIYRSKIKTPAYMQTHKTLVSNQQDFSPNCIYVGNSSALSLHLDIKTNINLILIKDSPIPDIYIKNENVNLTVLEKSIHPSEVLNMIADIMIDEASIISSMRLLLDALYENKGLQYLIDVAFEVFGNPIFVNDTAYKILAMSYKVTFDNETLEEEKTSGYIHGKNITDMKSDGIFKKLMGNDNPFYFKRDDEKYGWMFKTIKIQNIEIGVVALAEVFRPFRKYDYELLERFSKLIAIELEKIDFYKSNKGVMYNYFLADLISNKIHNREIIYNRLSYLDWKLSSHFQIIFVADLDNMYLEYKSERIANEIHQIIRDCHWTVYQKNLIILLNRSNKQLLSSTEYERLFNFLKSNRLSAGLSCIYTDIAETAKHYFQALRSVELGVHIHHKSDIYNYSDYVISYIGESLSKTHDLNEFCPPSITILQEYDKNHNADLIDTLSMFLNYPENPVLVSKLLNIHRNTLAYRINKIKELCDVDLSNGYERLKIQLYFKFMEYMKGGWIETNNIE